MNYPRFLNNLCWYQATTISIWKEYQCFGLPLVIQEVLGEVVTKLNQNKAEFCLGSMPALRRQTTEEQHYFALWWVESGFLDLSEKLRSLASREGINRQKGPPQKLYCPENLKDQAHAEWLVNHFCVHTSLQNTPQYFFHCVLSSCKS